MSTATVMQCVQAKRVGQKQHEVKPVPVTKVGPEVAFYRKYTEGLLRRYVYRSMEIGKVPSLLGDFSFRGRSSNRRSYTFEDAVIFVHDVERCLMRLKPPEQEMVKRIGLQEYTLTEAAMMAGISVRTAGRRYFDALDQLTRTFLRLGLMEVPSGR